jgi:glutamate dehydrogenase
MNVFKGKHLTPVEEIVKKESLNCEKFYLWLTEHMPPSFFEAVEPENLLLITHALMNFDLQEYFSHIHLKGCAFILCLDSPDADLKILANYRIAGIKSYRTFISNQPPPFPGLKRLLRVAILLFTEFAEKSASEEPLLSPEYRQEILEKVKMRNAAITDEAFAQFLNNVNSSFLRSLTKERLILAVDLFFRAQQQDTCQYEALLTPDWHEKKEMPSLRIVLAWRGAITNDFLYRLAKVVYRHHLTMKRTYATTINPYSQESVLIMSLGLDGIHGEPAWEAAVLPDFLQELVTFKYFSGGERIESLFVDSGMITGNLGNFLKTVIDFVHQSLVHIDLNIYSPANIEEALCRHPELTVQLTEAFDKKFNPETSLLDDYHKVRDHFLKFVDQIDTGNELNDTRRKNVLKQAMHFIEFTLKTNFYRENKTAFSFRLDPGYLDNLPIDRQEKFPELPFAIFFIKGKNYIGFHIRFRDLSRGGLRTVFPERPEQMMIERNHLFSECYGLAYTQQKKNKDIPEGGAKAVIFLEPFERSSREESYQKELQTADLSSSEVESKIDLFHQEQKRAYLYHAQRSYIEAFLTLINCDPDGKLKATQVVDYYKKPEYIYLGPDENMHNEMIVWISNYSKSCHYKPGGTFMSSKPGAGINHKEYGVTSLGVNVYMEEILKYLKIDPSRDPFTIKMSGGPDGDVAGNQILNLHRLYPKTAKLLALKDASGLLFDPEGLDFEVLIDLFKRVKPLRFYSPDRLSEGAFLLDTYTKREEKAYVQQTLCWRREKGKLNEEWLSGNEMNHLLRYYLHQVKSDIFIPAGGRPRTLNENNYKEFLDETGKPTSQAIIEGANLYLTPWARLSLEKLGVLIVKDSSANKGGVICSSFETLSGLVLSEEEFIREKPILIKEILESIQRAAKNEAHLLLQTHEQKSAPLTEVSDWISQKINTFMYQILDYLQRETLATNPEDPLIRCLLSYCPPLLRTHYQKRILTEIPDLHKKAIIACYLASHLVYRRGIDWSPTIVDVLPLIAQDSSIITP